MFQLRPQGALLLLLSAALWSGLWSGLWCGLWSGLWPGAGAAQRRFSLHSQGLNWSEAVRFCSGRDSALAVILDGPQNTEAARTFTKDKAWIGLSRPWVWAQDGSLEWPGSEWNLPWADGEPQDKNCVSLHTDTRGLHATSCSDALQFTACYSEQQQRHFIKDGARTWTQARDECRSDSSVLSSLRDQVQIQQLLDVFYGRTTGGPSNGAGPGGTSDKTTTTTTTTSASASASAPRPESAEVWVGLSRQDWVWSDSAPVGWTGWDSDPSDSNPYCVVMETDGRWKQEDCDKNHQTVCHKDLPETTRTTVKLRLNPGSADLSHPAVQQSLLSQMEERLSAATGSKVRLTWRQCERQPSKTAPPTGCERDNP